MRPGTETQMWEGKPSIILDGSQGDVMPVGYLTREQEQRYGRYTRDPTEAELAQHFYLDARDWDLLGRW